MDQPINIHIKRFITIRNAIILLIIICICVPFMLYSELNNSLENGLDIKYDKKCGNNRQSNWKFGSLSDSNRDDIRIRNSLAAELSEIASKRDIAQKTYEELIANNTKLEENLHELELLVKELNLKKKEYADLRNVRLVLPHKPLLSTEFEDRSLSLNDAGKVKFESAIDYSRCSISKKMLFYLYDLPFSEKDLVSKNFYNELSTHSLSTKDTHIACLFIGIVTHDFNQENYKYFNQNGRNHVFIFVNQMPANVNLVKYGIIVNSHYDFNLFRSGMDISSYLRIPASDISEWERLTPLLPHNRHILLSFESSNNGVSEKEIQDFINLNKSALKSKDQVKIIYDCNKSESSTEVKALCGTKKERSNLLKQSVFVLLYPNIPSFNQRFYEALESGAIPVVLSTTAVLPFDEYIDWKHAVLKIPPARFPEIHYILRTISIADQLEMRRKGRFYFESYMLNSKKLIETILSVLRNRLQLPATDLEDVTLPPLYNESYGFQNVSRQQFHEKLGPVETPIASQAFLHNFTTFNLYNYKIWNNYPFYTKITPKYFLDDIVMPSESEFYEETNAGMRPIAPGSGDTFSEALGGNRPGEQFTVVMVTYNRDDILYWQLENLNKIPYLNKVVVIWNNIGRDPPKVWPKIHVPVHFVKAQKNSLNNRFLPLDLIETECVLSLDDDMDLRQDEIVFAFRVWIEHRTRIVGFPARYHARYDNEMFYNSNHTCQYSMILTGAAFIHKSYFYAYTYMLPEIIHKKIDEVMNCEDIAMNFLVSHITREPPVKTTGKWTIRCPNCAENLSNDPQHFEERHECIRFFTKVFGYNPLLFAQYRVDSVLFKTRVPPNHQKCYQAV